MPYEFLLVDAFYEAVWHGSNIGDGADLEEAIQSFISVRPDDDDWFSACLEEGANPHVNRFASFDAYLDNAEPLELIPLTSIMIEKNIDQLSV